MVSGHLRDAARLRLAVTLVFGLIHGFGFAANLLEMWLLTERLFELLLGFNLGVEIGQLSLILTVLGIFTGQGGACSGLWQEAMFSRGVPHQLAPRPQRSVATLLFNRPPLFTLHRSNRLRIGPNAVIEC